MRASNYTWATRVLWLLLPLTLGETFSGALDGRTRSAVIVWSIVLWSGWAVTLLATLLLTPFTLTVIRVVLPMTVGSGAIGAVLSTPPVIGWLGLALVVVATVVGFAAEVGNDFVDGPSYGDERRLSLRPPSALFLGPIQVAWVVTVGPPSVAAALLGAEVWIGGALVGVAGLVGAWWGFRTMSRLASRWIVMVPAGLTVVDHLALAEPTLFGRDSIRRLGPAPIGLEAVDLTAGAAGLIVSVEFDRPISLVPVPRRRRDVAEAVDATAVLLAPSRPGLLLAEAQRRRIAVGRD